MIPKIIHLVCLPPYTGSEADENIKFIKTTNPDYEVMVHTEPPKGFEFKGMPVSGPSGLSNLVRMDCLRQWGGWYFDLDVQVRCDLNKLEKILYLGENLAISQTSKHGGGVCTFVSCCPANWSGWNVVVPYIQNNPSSNKGHYCTNVMGKLSKENPYFCDFLPSKFVYSDNWLLHKK